MQLGYQKPKIILPTINNNDDYRLANISYSGDFLSILDIYPCVDLVFTPNKKDLS